jgi:radical SAM protein with 4Fe4S-binding SPASM domain
MSNLEKLKKAGVRLIIKSNCLTLNKHEVAKVKKWTEGFLGKPARKRHYFKYDPMIYPRLNGDKSPCNYRLSISEIDNLRKDDPDIWEEYNRSLKSDMPDLERDRKFLYRCNSWMKQFFIDPFGRMKCCEFSDKCSVDLSEDSFREGFYNIFPQLLTEKFKTKSKCKDCPVRALCYQCPGRAYLETGNEEAPVDYYCMLAHETEKRLKK